MSPTIGPIHVNPHLTPPLRAADGSLWRVLELKGIELGADGKVAQYTCTLAPVSESGPTPPHDVDLPAFDSVFRRGRSGYAFADPSAAEPPPDRSWLRFEEPHALRTWFGRQKITDDRGVEHCPTCDQAEGARGDRRAYAGAHCADRWHHRIGWRWRWGRGGPPHAAPIRGQSDPPEPPEPLDDAIRNYGGR